MSSFSGIKGPSFLPELEGPGRLQICQDKIDGDDHPHRRIIVTFGNRHAIRYDLEDNSVVSGYYCPTFLTLSTPISYDSSISSYVCGVNAGKDLIIWDGQEIKLQNIINNQKSANKQGQEMVLKLEANEAAVGLIHLKNVSSGDHGPECYVIFKNGHLQTVKYLLDYSKKDGEEIEKNSRNEDMVPKNSTRLDTSLFITGEVSSLIYVAHAYKLAKKSYVRVCQIMLNAETGKCQQKLLRTIELENDKSAAHKSNDKEVSSLSFFGPIVTFIKGGEVFYLNILSNEGKKSLACLKKSDAPVVDFAPINLTPDKNQSLSLMPLNERRVALIGPRRDGEGYVITVVDAVFDVVVASTRIKTVHAETNTKETENGNVSYLMVCFAGERIFFKHGSKVANVILSEELPCRLSGFVGHEANLDLLPSEDLKKKFPLECDEMDECSELPQWKNVNAEEENTGDCLGEASQTLDLYRKMPEILAKRDFSAIEKVLSAYTDIPELLVLNIIEALIMEDLRRKHETPENEIKQKHSKANLSMRSLLVIAFNLPITETLMIQHVRQCRFELAKNTLAWIVTEMKYFKTRKQKVDLDQSLIWIGLILNSHYTNFILSKGNEEVKDLIIATTDLIGETQVTMDILSSTLPLTKMIRNAAKDKSSSSACSSAAVMGLMRSTSTIGNVGNMANRAYSIEIVEL